MTKRKQVILPPSEGWQPHSYYLVEAAFHLDNPINGYVFYTGFLDKDGRPEAYNEFALTHGLALHDCVYLQSVRLLATEESIKTIPNFRKSPRTDDLVVLPRPRS